MCDGAFRDTQSTSISLVERRQGPCKGIAWRRFKPRLWSAAKQAFSWAMLRSLVSFIRSRGWDTMGYSKFAGLWRLMTNLARCSQDMQF